MSNVPLFVWPIGPIINTEPIRYVVNKTDHDLVVDALREQNRVLREALKQFCDATETVAARMAYQCGLGAGEWEAFIDQTNYYQQYKQGKAALAGQEGTHGSRT